MRLGLDSEFYLLDDHPILRPPCNKCQMLDSGYCAIAADCTSNRSENGRLRSEAPPLIAPWNILSLVWPQAPIESISDSSRTRDAEMGSNIIYGYAGIKLLRISEIIPRFVHNRSQVSSPCKS